MGLLHPKAPASHCPFVYQGDFGDTLEAIDSKGHAPVPQGPWLDVEIDWEWVERNRTGVMDYGAQRSTMPRVPVVERYGTEEAFQSLRVEDLKPLARLLDDSVPPRKGELARLLTGVMQDPAKLRELYSGMSELDQAAVREAVQHPDGTLDAVLFSAKYGQTPGLGGRSSGTTLRLFFPYGSSLPLDLQQRLLPSSPQPRTAAITPCAELPEQFERQETLWDRDTRKSSVETWFEPVRVRETEWEALHDLPAVLRLIDAGKLGVSATTHRPGQAAQKAVGAVLQGGDFYTGEEEGIPEEERGDLAIKTFAWPLIVQAALASLYRRPELRHSRLRRVP